MKKLLTLVMALASLNSMAGFELKEVQVLRKTKSTVEYYATIKINSEVRSNVDVKQEEEIEFAKQKVAESGYFSDKDLLEKYLQSKYCSKYFVFTDGALKRAGLNQKIALRGNPFSEANPTHVSYVVTEESGTSRALTKVEKQYECAK